MAELRFLYGTMGSGKSTVALQMHHNHRAAGREVVLCTRFDRAGGRVSSRIGWSHPAVVVGPGVDVEHLVCSREPSADSVIADEAQFYTPEQVEQLARLVDDHDVEVVAFGLLVDFSSRLFPATRRLIELADHVEELHVDTLCWCGRRATHNARVVAGAVARTGAQVVIGDLHDDGPDRVRYQVLCRRHHRSGDLGADAGTDAPGPGEGGPR